MTCFVKTILTAVYGVAAAFALLCGWFYPEVLRWSYLAAGVCLIHGVLSVVVAVRSIADAGKIAAWCWHGLSTLAASGLLLAYVLRQEGGWFLAAAALTGFTLLVTLVLTLVLKPDGAAFKR